MAGTRSRGRVQAAMLTTLVTMVLSSLSPSAVAAPGSSQVQGLPLDTPPPDDFISVELVGETDLAVAGSVPAAAFDAITDASGVAVVAGQGELSDGSHVAILAVRYHPSLPVGPAIVMATDPDSGSSAAALALVAMRQFPGSIVSLFGIYGGVSRSPKARGIVSVTLHDVSPMVDSTWMGSGRAWYGFEEDPPGPGYGDTLVAQYHHLLDDRLTFSTCSVPAAWQIQYREVVAYPDWPIPPFEHPEHGALYTGPVNTKTVTSALIEDCTHLISSGFEPASSGWIDDDPVPRWVFYFSEPRIEYRIRPLDQFGRPLAPWSASFIGYPHRYNDPCWDFGRWEWGAPECLAAPPRPFDWGDEPLPPGW
ncbi:MAG: hypothetical protein JJLCMIEE_02871 [Acidimicrobiales bacterium]|nr:MAG: hypothetical protein EDR02_15070 [Actinomycetota bacterium]MBV6509772.1 hypothetical protein [Acidimicrobiales bacterium]RIK04374.1 MAG: hypothetical protein DCC48_13415 [Acidobacteriota bacterium]